MNMLVGSALLFDYARALRIHVRIDQRVNITNCESAALHTRVDILLLDIHKLQSKGSFTIVNIYLLVQRVLI